MDILQEFAINELLESPAGKVIAETMETITKVQRNLLALSESDDSYKLSLLKIGTVFQIFLIDTLSKGKKPEDLKDADWKNIAQKVSDYAILSDGQSYSAFVFTLYADYIELSAEAVRIYSKSKEKAEEVKAMSDEIRHYTVQLENGELSETEYIDKCLWLSLEAMIKCLSMSLAFVIGSEYAQLVQAVSQLAFEYGRYVLYAKEQEILQRYIENQYILDEELQKRYEAYLEEVRECAARFQNLVDSAFTIDLHAALVQSVELAKAAGVPEEELLTSMDDIDDFFMS